MSSLPSRPVRDQIHTVAYLIGRGTVNQIRPTFSALADEIMRRFPGLDRAHARDLYRAALQGLETAAAAAALPGQAPLSLAAQAGSRPTGPVRVMVYVYNYDSAGDINRNIVSVPASWDWTVDQVFAWARQYAEENWSYADYPPPAEGVDPLPPDEIYGPIDFPGPNQM